MSGVKIMLFVIMFILLGIYVALFDMGGGYPVWFFLSIILVIAGVVITAGGIKQNDD